MLHPDIPRGVVRLVVAQARYAAAPGADGRRGLGVPTLGVNVNGSEIGPDPAADPLHDRVPAFGLGRRPVDLCDDLVELCS